MFSKEIINDYGSYQRKNENTVLLKGLYDKNFKELTLINPESNVYKTFDSPSINFAIRIGNSTYIPTHIFNNLKTAYIEGNPYYTPNDVITIDLDISKTLSFIETKYGTQQKINKVNYVGGEIKSTTIQQKTTTSTITTKSGSVNVNQNAIITSNEPVVNTTSTVVINNQESLETRFEQAGVVDIQFQYYVDNNPNVVNDENIIKYLKFVFEDSNIVPKGDNKIVPYINSNGKVILENLPASTNVVPPAIERITTLDDYLKDVQRT